MCFERGFLCEDLPSNFENLDNLDKIEDDEASDQGRDELGCFFHAIFHLLFLICHAITTAF